MRVTPFAEKVRAAKPQVRGDRGGHVLRVSFLTAGEARGAVAARGRVPGAGRTPGARPGAAGPGGVRPVTSRPPVRAPAGGAAAAENPLRAASGATPART